MIICALVIAILSPSSRAAPNPQVDAHLARFFENPLQVMNESPERWDGHGSLVPVGTDLKFSPASIADGSALRARTEQRAPVLRSRSASQGNDRPENLVDGRKPLRTLEAIEAAGLLSAQLPTAPWSGDYWGFYKGIIAARYADPDFPTGNNWKLHHEYVLQHPAQQIAQSGHPESIDTLSPAEKYELLTGDRAAHLTRRMWKTGQRYADSQGNVPEWRGICHGWAPAAFMLPRPTHSLNLLAADGHTQLTFYPSDIKALSSLLWANASAGVRFIGGRCKIQNPAMDANGRVTDPACFDTNPGTWHIAVTHQIGRAQRSFVMDASFDYEVWNQPVYAYSYGYFNPQTGLSVNSLDQAKVALSAFTRDKFKAYRSSRTRQVVGIVMDLTYVAETAPSHATSDSASDDSRRTVRYYYDLELNASSEIIGGEWYNNLHPDFLWVPAPGAHARTGYDWLAFGAWNPSSRLPQSWRNAAIAAESSGQPLGKIVEQMLSWSASW